MRDHFDNDELLERLRAEDPAAGADAEAPEEREAIRSRVNQLLESDSREPKRQLLRPRLAIAAVTVVVAVAAGLSLTLGGSSSGPATALAIEKTPRWVTLRLTDPTASDAQMNQELADAGIDRVRVRSVPGDPRSVGTWAGYVEVGPRCLGGVTFFGYDVDIPVSHPFNRANRHGAENLFDLKLPLRSGAVIAQEAGVSHSKSVVRLPTKSVDDPRNAVKVLVPVRPRNPDDTSTTNDIGADQLIALGGVFAQYGNAIKSGQTSCKDFGLKPFSEAPFPPSPQGWVVVHVTASRGGAQQMTRELRSGGIKGKVRQIPARRIEVGRYISLVRVPPLQDSNPIGNGSGAYVGADVVTNSNAQGPAQNDIALRRSAFDAYPDARWIVYVGRHPRPGEKVKVVGENGPETERRAAAQHCKGFVTEVGKGRCRSLPRLQVPAP